MSPQPTEIISILKALGDSEKIGDYQRFFKTAKGQYAHGDVFLGIKVPVLRAELKKHQDLTLDHAIQLLQSELHEVRFFALILMNRLFSKNKETVYQAYLTNRPRINNWDLVDISTHKIVGAYLLDKNDRSILDDLIKSDTLWDRRIAVVACWSLIRQGDYTDILRLSAKLLDDPEDLMHKAVGWMLREVGKKSIETQRAFLMEHYTKMPRTMLRYAIEHLSKDERQDYLKGRV